jgi:hypothetical protein
MLALSSCITILGITNDYNKLNEEEKSLIHYFSSKNELIDGNVYLINAQQLKKELEKHDKSIVYCFTNGCSSENCEPIENYLSYARENGFELFLVMSGFGNMSSTLDQSANTPYYAIDPSSYSTKYKSRYTRRFVNELLNRELDYKENEYSGNLYFFQGKDHIETRRKLNN